MSEFHMEDAGEGSSSSAYPEVTATESHMEYAGEAFSSGAQPEVAATDSDMEDDGEGPDYSTHPAVAAMRSNIEDPDEDDSSDASTEIDDFDFEYDSFVSQHHTLTDSAKSDDGSDEEDEDSSLWEDVPGCKRDVNIAPDTKVITELAEHLSLQKPETPTFGGGRSHDFLAPARTGKAFPPDWNEAQKAVAISPSSGYYEIPQPPREFPADWTPAQIAAANSSTSPLHFAPGVPTTSTTLRLSEKRIPGLLSHLSTPPQASGAIFCPQPDQTSSSSGDQAQENAALHAGLPQPSGRNPFNPGQHPSPLTQNIPRSINPASITQDPSQSVDSASSSSSSLIPLSSNPSQSTIPQRPTPASQAISAESMVYIHSKPSTSRSSSTSAKHQQEKTSKQYANTLKRSKGKEYRETDKADEADDEQHRVPVPIQGRPVARPKSQLAKFGNMHLQQNPNRPVGGPNPANDVPCALCRRNTEALFEATRTQARMETEVAVRKHMEAGLRHQLEGLIDQQYREKIATLQAERDDLLEKYNKVWCEKDQLNSDCRRLEQEKADLEDKHTVDLMEYSIATKNDVRDALELLKSDPDFDVKVEQMAKLMLIRKKGELPSFTQKDLDNAAREALETQIPILEARLKSSHDEKIAQMTADFQAEISRLQAEGQTAPEITGAPMDENQYQAKLDEKQKEFDRKLAEQQQSYNNALAGNQQTLNNTLAGNQQAFENEVKKKNQELEEFYQAQMAEQQNECDLRINDMSQQLNGYLTGPDPEEYIREMENKHKRDFRDKHTEYANALTGLRNQFDAEMIQKNQEIIQRDQEIATLRAENASLRESEPPEPIDEQDSLKERLEAEVTEESKEKFREEGRQQAREESTNELDQARAAQIQADFQKKLDQAKAQLQEEFRQKEVKLQKDYDVEKSAVYDLLDKEKAQLRRASNAKIEKERKIHEEQLRAALAQQPQNIPTSAEVQALTQHVDTSDPSNLAEPQDPSEPVVAASSKPDVADAHTSIDADELDSLAAGFSNLVVVENPAAIERERAKPAVIQGSSKSELAGSASPIKPGSSKPDTSPSPKSTATESSISVVADSFKSTDSTALHSAVADLLNFVDTLDSSTPTDTDSSKPLATQDSSNSVPTQTSSSPAFSKDSSTPAESQIQTSSAPAETQVISIPADVTNSSPIIDAPHPYKAKLDAEHERIEAEIRRRTEEAEATLKEKYRKMYDDHIRAVKREAAARLAEARVNLDQQYGTHFEKLRKELQDKHDAELRQQDAELRQRCDDEKKEERIKMTDSIRAELKESSEGMSPKNSDKTDGQDVGTTSKTDGQDAELLKVRKQLAELQDKYKLLQADFDAEQRSYSELSEEFDSFAKREQAIKKQLESSKHQVAQLQNALEGTNDIVRSQRAQLSEYDRRHTELKEVASRLQSDFSQADKEAREAIEALNELRRTKREADASVHSLRETNEELRQANEDLLSELRDREPSQADAIIEFLCEEKNGLEAQVRRLGEDKNELERQDEIQRQEIHRLRAECAQAQQDLGTANSRAVAATQDLDEARQANSGLVADITRAREENAALGAEIAALGEENAALRAEITALDAENVALEAARGTSQGGLGTPRWVTWLLIGFLVVFVGVGVLSSWALAAEREAQQWLGGNDMPPGSMTYVADWGIGTGGIL